MIHGASPCTHFIVGRSQAGDAWHLFCQWYPRQCIKPNPQVLLYKSLYSFILNPYILFKAVPGPAAKGDISYCAACSQRNPACKRAARKKLQIHVLLWLCEGDKCNLWCWEPPLSGFQNTAYVRLGKLFLFLQLKHHINIRQMRCSRLPELWPRLVEISPAGIDILVFSMLGFIFLSFLKLLYIRV